MSDVTQRAAIVREYLGEHLRDMLEMVEQFVNVESGSRDKDDVDHMGEVYRQVLEPMGFTTEIIEQPSSGNHYVFRRDGNGEGRVMLLAHLDTVWPRGTLAWWPFKITGDTATGPGVGDMKGGIVQAIFALRAIETLGLKLPGKTTFFFVGDEELGSPTAKPHVESVAKEHDAVLVVEPSLIDGAITLGRGGIGQHKIEVTGKTAHSTEGPGIGASAIHALAAKIVELAQLTDWDRKVITNVGIIEGGSARQTQAGSASAWLDLRAQSEADADELMAKVNAIIEKEHVPGTRATLTGNWNRLPSPQTDADRRLFDRAAVLADAVGYRLHGKHVGTGSDGTFTSRLGIPTLDGLGTVSDEVVSAREYIKIDSLPERAALIALLLDDIATNGKV